MAVVLICYEMTNESDLLLLLTGCYLRTCSKPQQHKTCTSVEGKALFISVLCPLLSFQLCTATIYKYYDTTPKVKHSSIVFIASLLIAFLTINCFLYKMTKKWYSCS